MMQRTGKTWLGDPKEKKIKQVKAPFPPVRGDRVSGPNSGWSRVKNLLLKIVTAKAENG